jgi:sensor histidine kinase regulating citrate/malate metabolism
METLVLLGLLWIATGVLLWRQRPRRVVSLRLSLTCLALSLTWTLVLLLLVERRQQALIVRQMEQRGATIATQLAAVSTKSLLTYNFVTLEQDAEQTAKAREVLYTIIHDRDGRVAAYSGHSEQQGLVLADAVSWQAATANTMLIQRVRYTQGTAEHYDIAVPVFVPNSPEKWGTVRVGVSLHEMHREIAQTHRQGLWWGVLGIGASVVGAAFLNSHAQRTDHVR